jgi:colanic acid/amylovoran biosynthesis glycosyltransferase
VRMTVGNSNPRSAVQPVKVIYIIGRYPELTNTFIDREIDVLRQLGYIEVQTVSIRYPLTPSAISLHHREARENTLYLVPKRLLNFDLLNFIAGNLRFILLDPLTYFGTLIYLLTHIHPNLKSRLKTILHFWQGTYAAHLLRKQDFDHVHAHFIDRAVVVALVVGRLLRKPYSLTAHASSIFREEILIREKIVNAKFVVTVSQYNKKHFLTTYSGLNRDKVYVLHPWVDLSHFVPPSTRPTQDRLHILSVGRLVEKKGHIYLIEACHLLKEQGLDFECRIVGGGPLRPELEAGIAQYGLQDYVHLVGRKPPSEVLQLLGSWADVFVLPCVIAKDGDRDGIPVSLAEAMAMELPVISTDIVGISELVQPGTGVLVPPHDAMALAEELRAIYAASPSTRAEMGRRGRAVVDAEFNLVKGTTQLAQRFREGI